MSESSLPVITHLVKIESQELKDRRKEFMEKLIEFLVKDQYRYCLVAIPGFGKSTSILQLMLENNYKFLYVAATKDTADQLALKCQELGFNKPFNKPLVIHGNSDDTFTNIPDQCITIYDHFSKFVDGKLLSDKICIIDEAANLILQREYKFRYKAIRKMELKLKYFKKVVFMSATPIDYRAYGDNLEVIKIEDNSPSTTLFAVPFGTYSEMKDIAEICKHEILTQGKQVVVYLQSLGEQLSELKQYLRQLNIKSISFYNSQEQRWKLELENGTIETEPLDIKGTSKVKGNVLITTYSDGISILNEGFSFISCSKADYHTVYQAMNRFRKGCARYYVMSNAYDWNGKDCETVYEQCRQQVLAEAEFLQLAVEAEDDIEERNFFITEKRITLVNLNGEIDQAEVIRQTVIKQHQHFAKNFNGLKSAYAKYNIDLKHLSRIPNRSELDYTAESKEKVLNGIFDRLADNEFIPNIHPEREYLEKIQKLLNYMNLDEVKQFMLTEFVKRSSAYDEKLQQLKLDFNAIDTLLKVRLMRVLESGRKYTSDELEGIVSVQCTEIGYKLNRTINSTLIGLGFEVKPASKYLGLTSEGKQKTQKMWKVIF